MALLGRQRHLGVATAIEHVDLYRALQDFEQERGKHQRITETFEAYLSASSDGAIDSDGSAANDDHLLEVREALRLPQVVKGTQDCCLAGNIHTLRRIKTSSHRDGAIRRDAIQNRNSLHSVRP